MSSDATQTEPEKSPDQALAQSAKQPLVTAEDHINALNNGPFAECSEEFKTLKNELCRLVEEAAKLSKDASLVSVGMKIGGRAASFIKNFSQASINSLEDREALSSINHFLRNNFSSLLDLFPKSVKGSVSDSLKKNYNRANAKLANFDLQQLLTNDGIDLEEKIKLSEQIAQSIHNLTLGYTHLGEPHPAVEAPVKLDLLTSVQSEPVSQETLASNLKAIQEFYQENASKSFSHDKASLADFLGGNFVSTLQKTVKKSEAHDEGPPLTSDEIEGILNALENHIATYSDDMPMERADLHQLVVDHQRLITQIEREMAEEFPGDKPLVMVRNELAQRIEKEKEVLAQKEDQSVVTTWVQWGMVKVSPNNVFGIDARSTEEVAKNLQGLEQEYNKIISLQERLAQARESLTQVERHDLDVLRESWGDDLSPRSNLLEDLVQAKEDAELARKLSEPPPPQPPDENDDERVASRERFQSEEFSSVNQQTELASLSSWSSKGSYFEYVDDESQRLDLVLRDQIYSVTMLKQGREERYEQLGRIDAEIRSINDYYDEVERVETSWVPTGNLTDEDSKEIDMSRIRELEAKKSELEYKLGLFQIQISMAEKNVQSLQNSKVQLLESRDAVKEKCIDILNKYESGRQTSRRLSIKMNPKRSAERSLYLQDLKAEINRYAQCPNDENKALLKEKLEQGKQFKSSGGVDSLERALQEVRAELNLPSDSAMAHQRTLKGQVQEAARRLSKDSRSLSSDSGLSSIKSEESDESRSRCATWSPSRSGN